MVASQACEEFFSAQPGMRGRPVSATGWPRYDQWFDLDRPPIEMRTTFTLLAYGDSGSYHYATQNFLDVLRIFCAAVRKQRQTEAGRSFRFVIKLKKANEGGYIYDAVPDISALGIEVRADVPLPELFGESRVVIGYNTLAILEGLLGDSAVVVPFWGDAERGVFESLLHPDEAEDREVSYFPRAPEEFETMLQQSLAGRLPALGTREQRLRRFSRHSLFSREQTSSRKVEAFIRQVLDSRAGVPAGAPHAEPHRING
jgi:hypothetical protein